MRKAGFKREHCHFEKTRKNTSDAGQHLIRSRAGLSAGSPGYPGTSSGSTRSCISPDLSGIALVCNSCEPTRPKVPFSSTENENMFSGTVNYQEALYNRRIFLWGYWAAGTHVKQMLCGMSDSSGVWERVGCCK